MRIKDSDWVFFIVNCEYLVLDSKERPCYIDGVEGASVVCSDDLTDPEKYEFYSMVNPNLARFPIEGISFLIKYVENDKVIDNHYYLTVEGDKWHVR